MSDSLPASESSAGLLAPPALALEIREANHRMAAPGGPLGPPFPIPSFNQSGVLPPYLGQTPTKPALVSPYRTDLVQIASRLCSTGPRRQIFQGLLAFRRFLASVDIQDGVQWLAGSFTEDIETLENRSPRDVDVVTLFRRPAGVRNNDTAWEKKLQPVLGALRSGVFKTQFQCDAHFIDLDIDGLNVAEHTRYWYGLFSHRRSGLWKGMLEVSLACGQDDDNAAAMLGGDVP